MSNNIFSSNDDDIFEDYVDSSSNTFQEESFADNTKENMDKVFGDIDSPFRSLIDSSSLKVNFGDAFYNASYEWIHQGYREANSCSIISALADLTDGKFLYHHRMMTSFEVLNRKKTIIRFLNIVLNDKEAENIIKVAGKNSDIKFSETYFNMFFRSFYNIQIHTYYCELAVYMSLCDLLEIEPDTNVIDPNSDQEIKVLDSVDHLNSLYIKHFPKEELADKIKAYTDDFFAFKDEA